MGLWSQITPAPAQLPTGIPFDIALVLTKLVQDYYPDYRICGSMALMLADLLPKGEVHDLDFATRKCVTSTHKRINQTSRSIRNKNAPYICYGFQYRADSLTFNYDVFYYPDLEDGPIIDGFKLQSIDQIIYWKRQFNRPKDKEMLSKIQDRLDNILLEVE